MYIHTMYVNAPFKYSPYSTVKGTIRRVTRKLRMRVVSPYTSVK